MGCVYTEDCGITTKTEFTEFDMVGWSVINAESIFEAVVVEFSIEKGLIARYTKIVHRDGSDYKARAYRNLCNGFTTVY